MIKQLLLGFFIGAVGGIIGWFVPPAPSTKEIQPMTEREVAELLERLREDDRERAASQR